MTTTRLCVFGTIYFLFSSDLGHENIVLKDILIEPVIETMSKHCVY